MKTETKIDPRARQFHDWNLMFNIYMRRCLNRWALVADIFYYVDGQRKMAEVYFGDKNAYGKGYTAFLKISDGVYLKTQGATKMEAAVKMANVLATSTISVSVA